MRSYPTEARAVKRASVLVRRYGIWTCIKRKTDDDGNTVYELGFDPELWELG
jgi:hypothetical protein